MNFGDYKPMVLDLSHHNTIPQDFEPAKKLGIRGIVHKATEGLGFKDKKYNARRQLAKEAGLLWGAYHFFRPGSVADQVDFFCDVAEPDQYTLLALDHEDEGCDVRSVKRFLALLEEKSGRKPVLYSGHVIKEQLTNVIDKTLGSYRLWHAQYGSTYKINSSWKAPWLWQFTEHGDVPGVEGNVDVNSFAGSFEKLSSEWAGMLPEAEVA